MLPPAPLSNQQALALLEKEVSRRFGKDSPLRPLQRKVLEELWLGKNIYAELPTGYGKSLCYWAPAAAWGWSVWVLSPLVSLIRDQAMAARSLGIPVGAWDGSLGHLEKKQLEQELLEGNLKLVFLSPERLWHWWESGFVERLQAEGCLPDLLALDEMHCFPQWRHFRRAYEDVVEPIGRLSRRGTKILGLSASLLKREGLSWMSEFCADPIGIESGIGRENLALSVVAIEEERERWLHLVSAIKEIQSPSSALVYAASREEVDLLVCWLRLFGLDAVAYHAGLSKDARESCSRGFREGRLPIVCATSAFGMGVDYPFVRKVIHFSMPYSVEEYWQEVGRAGRDGAPASALAIWKRSDVLRARVMDADEKKRFLCLWTLWAKRECRKKTIAQYFGKEESDCKICDRCCQKKIQENRAEDPPLQRSFFAADPWWLSEEGVLCSWAREKIFSNLEKS